MSKHNYNKAYDEAKKENCPVPVMDEEEVVEETAIEKPTTVEELVTAEVPELNNLGMVTCAKLNMRKEPSTEADIICVLKEDETVEIMPFNNDTFYKVKKRNTEGYCMKKFILPL